MTLQYKLTDTITVSIFKNPATHGEDTIDIEYQEKQNGEVVRVQYFKKKIHMAARTGQRYIKVKAPENKAQRRVYLSDFKEPDKIMYT